MIVIGRPYITTDGGSAYLRADMDITDDTVRKYIKVTRELRGCNWLTDTDYPPAAWEKDRSLWFSADERYSDHLCCERSNAFVTALFWYAMVTGSDISFEAPMSKRLYDGLVFQLMPALEKAGFAPIRLLGPLTSEPVSCEGGVVTGMSAGVDSFYTLHCYEGPDAPGGDRLTHLAYYEAFYYLSRCGQFPGEPYKVYEQEDLSNAVILRRAETVARHHHIPFVHMRTNIDRDFYRGGYIYMAMYRYLACSLALERLYRVYISSSSGHESGRLEVSLFSPTQHYEDLLCDCLRTESFQYITSDHALRPDKLRVVAEDSDFRRFASVCFNTDEEGRNCGECYGCWKTMIPLDMMGKLDGFGESFDLDRYHHDRRRIFEDLIRFSDIPAAASARDTVRQLLQLAETERSEAGDEFLEVYESLGRRNDH